MYFKKVKRKCSVRGCKNTNCFAISQTREIGNTVIICKECLKDALSSLDNIKPETKNNFPIRSGVIPALFFNAAALGLKSGSTAEKSLAPEDTYVSQEFKNVKENIIPLENNAKDIEHINGGLNSVSDNETAFKCHVCGRKFESEKSLKIHLRKCSGGNRG